MIVVGGKTHNNHVTAHRITTPLSLTPRFNRATGLLGMSYAQFHPSEMGPFGEPVLKLLSTLRLISMETDVGPKKDQIRVNNFTIINFVLKLVGPTHEQTLTAYLMGIQVGAGPIPMHGAGLIPMHGAGPIPVHGAGPIPMRTFSFSLVRHQDNTMYGYI